MIQGKKVIAVTPSGRARFMDILAKYVARDVRRGLIDEWIVYDNCYNAEDSAFTKALQNLGQWVRYIPGPVPFAARNTGHIHHSYAHLVDSEAVYVRLDDDICYVDPHAIDYLVSARLADPQPWIFYPTIFNNTRMSYMLQQAGVLPPSPVITNHFLDVTSWRSGEWVAAVHDVALPAAEAGTLGALALPARRFLTGPGPGALDRNHGEGRISVNCYAVLGRDIVGRQVPVDEENYMADTMPKQLNRGNAIAPGAAVVHFAYHCQPGLEEAGYLAAYAALAHRQT